MNHTALSTMTFAMLMGLQACAGNASDPAADAPSTIRAAMAGALPRVQACYDGVLRTAPTASGRVVMRFAVDAAGTVGSVEVGSADPAVAAAGPCIATALTGMSVALPFGTRPMTVTYPFVLRHDGPQAL